MSHNLISRFSRAGLDLRLANAPFALGTAANAANIFQLDIRRERAHDVRSEHFLAWTGAQENLAQVHGVDARERQLVLVIREGAAEFEEAVPRFMVQLAARDLAAGSLEWKKAIAARLRVPASVIVARTGGASIVRTTKGSTRHMLVGRDERQLFMCELPEACTTVRQAHEALRTPLARSRSRSALERPVRQGEWFFVLASPLEVEALERDVERNRVIVRNRVGINAFIPRSGKAHVADEIVRHVSSTGEIKVFVRGGIRHPDHKTVHLRQWRRVVRNLEVDQARSPLGGTWVD